MLGASTTSPAFTHILAADDALALALPLPILDVHCKDAVRDIDSQTYK